MRILYISDSENIHQMTNFWNKNMKSQNKKENIKEWIGGEYYIQTSLYNQLVKMKNCKIIDFDKVRLDELLIYFTNAEFIIIPGWHNQLPITHKYHHLFTQFHKKIFSYIFFEYSNKKYLDDKKFITPWKYNNINNFIPITPIELPPINNYNPFFKDNKENGIIYSKCIGHFIHKQKIEKLYQLIQGLEYRVLSVLRNLESDNIPSYINKDIYSKYIKLIINNSNINNLGILNPLDFRLLLKKIKYIIFYHTAFAQPTIIEALYEKCIILSTQDCIPNDLLSNKNIYLIDNLNQNQINKLISEIESDKIYFLDNKFPSDYTVNNKITCINNLTNLH